MIEYCIPDNVVSGVYKITLQGPKKYFYIGSTNNFKRRHTKHVQLLRENKHKSNPKFQNIFNKYREYKWIFECIRQVTDENKILDIEQKYLDMYYGTPLCINLNPIACKPPSAKGRVYSAEMKKKFSVAKLGWKPTEEMKHNMSIAARKRNHTIPFYLISEMEKKGPFYTFKEVKQAGIMDDSSACELYNSIGNIYRKGYYLKRITN